ncbi:MAG: DUF2330 domain-containing protein [Bacteroidia bacterium]|nr:DUF2330 domain-containing protein [Bacteroidia bacterium]MDW8334307.1 DUF2330 domain-containing protein [Bacteroidia bacterium]
MKKAAKKTAVCLAFWTGCSVLWTGAVRDGRAMCVLMTGQAPPGPAPALAKIYNSDSKVIVARKGKNTVITMTNDFRGATGDFALIVPVPHVLPAESIRTVRTTIFDSLDRYSAPRLVEFTEPNPCLKNRPPRFGCGCSSREEGTSPTTTTTSSSGDEAESANIAGFVQIEGRYWVGEYEIVILTARQAEDLSQWLSAHGYAFPAEAQSVVQSYLQAGMKFFVAKVAAWGIDPATKMDLSPLQIRFESERFMLPVRLGMTNSAGEQDLTIFVFTEKGRAEAANYPTHFMPWGLTLPSGVRDTFAEFYRRMFRKNRLREGRNAVYIENAHMVSFEECDFCPLNPIGYEFLRACGVDWIKPTTRGQGFEGNVYLTRMHVLYEPADLPQDLVFVETADQSAMTAKYEIWRPFQGQVSCKVPPQEAQKHFERERRAQQTYNDLLADATDWPMRLRMLVWRIERALPRPEQAFAWTDNPGAVADFLLPWLLILPTAWGLRRRLRR